MSANTTKLLVGFTLLFTWIALVAFEVKGAEQIIDAIKYALALLFGYHAGDRINAQTATPIQTAPATPIQPATQPAKEQP